MKFSTRARYGLRLMVELAREFDGSSPVQLAKIASVTGLSDNYLAQLTISLRNAGLLVGVSGKNGGYMLASPADKITIGQIIRALVGPINIADCASKPEICLNSCFCETRIIWVLLTHQINEMLGRYTLKDLTNRAWMSRMRREYGALPLMDNDVCLTGIGAGDQQGCPVLPNKPD